MNATSVIQAIHAWRSSTQSPPRGHLGASQIGKARDCPRQLWYAFRFCQPPQDPNPRLLRLFETGYHEEKRLIHELTQIGAKVQTQDPTTRQTLRFVAHGDHFSGTCDGIATNLPDHPHERVLLEFKTSNHAQFLRLQKDGVELTHWTHFVQMQIYMHYFQLTKALYMVIDKNTDEHYAEYVPYSDHVAQHYIQIARQIILAKEPPPKVSEKEDYYVCSMCEFKSVCHGQKVPPVSCRTCVSATPTRQGQWRCDRHQQTLMTKTERVGCPQHLFIPPLIPFAKAIDASADHVSYSYQNKIFHNVIDKERGPHEYLSSELASLSDPHHLFEPFILEIKKIIPDIKIIG